MTATFLACAELVVAYNLANKALLELEAHIPHATQQPAARLQQVWTMVANRIRESLARNHLYLPVETLGDYAQGVSELMANHLRSRNHNGLPL